MTPDQIESTRELLAALPEDERPALARAAAEFLRLHDAIRRRDVLTIGVEAMSEKKTVKCFCCANAAWVRAKDAEDVRVPFCSDCFVETCLIGDDSVSYALQGLQLQSRSRYEELGIPMAKDAQ